VPIRQHPGSVLDRAPCARIRADSCVGFVVEEASEAPRGSGDPLVRAKPSQIRVRDQATGAKQHLVTASREAGVRVEIRRTTAEIPASLLRYLGASRRSPVSGGSQVVASARPVPNDEAVFLRRRDQRNSLVPAGRHSVQIFETFRCDAAPHPACPTPRASLCSRTARRDPLLPATSP
jgi:hypothetical protein